MFDLATAKTRLSITGNADDVALQGSLDTALALAEKYCDRFFMYASQRAKFYHVHGSSLQLRRFPVDQVIAFTPAGDQHKVHHVTGVIEFHRPSVIEEVVIDYSGGYKVLPPDLELALWQLFDSVWNSMSNAGQAAVAGAGAVQSITSEGQTVRFATGSQAQGGSVFDVMAGPDVPFSVLSILDMYRLESC